jgi:hypothetical protein
MKLIIHYKIIPNTKHIFRVKKEGLSPLFNFHKPHNLLDCQCCKWVVLDSPGRLTKSRSLSPSLPLLSIFSGFLCD